VPITANSAKEYAEYLNLFLLSCCGAELLHLLAKWKQTGEHQILQCKRLYIGLECDTSYFGQPLPVPPLDRWRCEPIQHWHCLIEIVDSGAQLVVGIVLAQRLR
jgi:hypothetical protein